MRIQELPDAKQNLQLVTAAALFIEHELVGNWDPSIDEVANKMEAFAGRTTLIGLDEDGLIIAAGGLMEEWQQGEGRIVDMVVADGYRSRGLGRFIVAELETIARSRNMERLNVSPLHRAMRFYEEHLGYKARGNGDLSKRL